MSLVCYILCWCYTYIILPKVYGHLTIRAHPQTVTTKLEAYNCVKCFCVLQHQHHTSLELRDLKNSPSSSSLLHQTLQLALCILVGNVLPASTEVLACFTPLQLRIAHSDLRLVRSCSALKHLNSIIRRGVHILLAIQCSTLIVSVLKCSLN